jgi:hypothetical protein
MRDIGLAIRSIRSSRFSRAVEDAETCAKAGIGPNGIVLAVEKREYTMPLTWDDAIFCLALARQKSHARLLRCLPVLDELPASVTATEAARRGPGIRRCLKCQGSFESEGAHNRICPTCSERNRHVPPGMEMAV